MLPSPKQEFSNESLDEATEADMMMSDEEDKDVTAASSEADIKKDMGSEEIKRESGDPEEGICVPADKNMPLRKPSAIHAEAFPTKETPNLDAAGLSPNILEQM